MSLKHSIARTLSRIQTGCVVLAVLQMTLAGPVQAQPTPGQAQSPIQHVIIIVGENRTFDHIFATYHPRRGKIVDNLLSKQIINVDGTPGPNYFLAAQSSADTTDSPSFELSPTHKTQYSVLPAPLTGGPGDACADNGVCTLKDSITSENGLPSITRSSSLAAAPACRARPRILVSPACTPPHLIPRSLVDHSS